MNAIMIYMSGNTVAIFSIMVTAMMFFQPIKALMAINKGTLSRWSWPLVFERLESEDEKIDLTLQKITFCFLNLLVIGMGVYKCGSMGLLPTSTSDWLAFETSPQVKNSRMLFDFGIEHVLSRSYQLSTQVQLFVRCRKYKMKSMTC